MKLIFSFIFRVIIILYQKGVSPFFVKRCRYTPTCSQYSLEAIAKYGPWKGGVLTVQRILKCHPWGGHGHAPVL